MDRGSARKSFMARIMPKMNCVTAEMALKKDGTILAAQGKFMGDIGAYTSYPWTPCFEPMQAALACPGPYKIKNVLVEAMASRPTRLPQAPIAAWDCRPRSTRWSI